MNFWAVTHVAREKGEAEFSWQGLCQNLAMKI
jgi:hypothetical protein